MSSTELIQLDSPKCGEMLGQFLGLFPLFLVRSNCPTVVCSVFSMLIPDILGFNATTPCIFSQKKQLSVSETPSEIRSMVFHPKNHWCGGFNYSKRCDSEKIPRVKRFLWLWPALTCPNGPPVISRNPRPWLASQHCCTHPGPHDIWPPQGQHWPTKKFLGFCQCELVYRCLSQKSLGFEAKGSFTSKNHVFHQILWPFWTSFLWSTF